MFFPSKNAVHFWTNGKSKRNRFKNISFPKMHLNMHFWKRIKMNFGGMVRERSLAKGKVFKEPYCILKYPLKKLVKISLILRLEFQFVEYLKAVQRVLMEFLDFHVILNILCVLG
jgi:hypothetical protein